MAAKSNGKGPEQPVAALAGESVSPVPRKRGRPPKLTTILGADAPMTPAAATTEPDPLVTSFGAAIDATVSELADGREKVHRARLEPLRAAQQALRAGLAAKTAEAERVTRRFAYLEPKLNQLPDELDRQWPPTEGCQRLLRHITRLVEELRHRLRNPVEEIARMIDKRTTDDLLRPESTWPQEIRKRIAGLAGQEREIEERLKALEEALPQLRKYAEQPVLTVKRIPESPEAQTMAVTE